MLTFAKKNLIATLAAFSCGLPVCAAEHDWLLVPGERAGPITANTSEAMLNQFFAEDEIEIGEIAIGEGFTEPGAVVYPNDPSQRIEIIWRDATRQSPREIWVKGDASKWHTEEGISLGNSLKQIETLNGYPFRLAGFGWDYGGTITDCGRGYLKMLGCVSTDKPFNRTLVLRLAPPLESRNNNRSAYSDVQGEKDFSSGHPAMQLLNPEVYHMIVVIK